MVMRNLQSGRRIVVPRRGLALDYQRKHCLSIIDSVYTGTSETSRNPKTLIQCFYLFARLFLQESDHILDNLQRNRHRVRHTGNETHQDPEAPQGIVHR